MSLSRNAALLWLLLLMAMPTAMLSGQQMPSGQQSTAVPSVPASPAAAASTAVAPGLPDEPSLRDRYRRVFFYQSEAARLVPPHYRPVALADLEALLEGGGEVGGPAANRPQLVRAVYVAYLEDEALRSERSWLDIRYRDDAVGQLDLGPVNLAISGGPELEQGVQPPRLVTTAEGTLRAVISRDCRIDFGWSLGGLPHADGTRSYEMVIPRCGQSRIVIGLPTTRLLRSADGVARLLPSPPPEAADGGAESSPRRWYEIEAGGLSRVQLQVYPAGRFQGETVLPIRQQTIDYQIGARAVHWTMRLVLDTVPGVQLPPLAIGRGRASEVFLAGEPVRWTDSSEDGESVLQFSSDTLIEGRGGTESVTLTVSGASEMAFDQLLPLAWPRWLQCHVVHAAPLADTQLRLDPNVTLMQAQMPAHWRTQPMIMSESGSRVYQWSGPPGDAGPTVRVSHQQQALAADAALRLVVRDDAIQGRWETVVRVDHPQPLRMQVEKDWRIDSVTLPASGRVIDTVIGDGTDRVIEVWPEPEDVRDGQIWLQVLGTRPLERPAQQRAPGRGWPIPSTWFVRLADSRTTSAAAIIPPAGFRWSGSTALRGSVPAADGLPGAIGDMLGPVPTGALLFHLPGGATPPLELEQPLQPFEVDVRLALDADDGEVFETLTVLCRTPAPEASEVRIRSGDPRGRPPLVWSIEAGDAAAGAMAMPVTARRDESTVVEEGESWLITLPSTTSAEVRLIGRRRYPLAGSQSIDLPSVPQAATQRTAVEISPRLRLESTGGPVLRLPSGSEGEAGNQQLRYDPSEPASITVAAAAHASGVALSWQTDVDYFVSTRSGDDVVGRFQIEAGRPLRIKHDPQLRLLGAEIDGEKAAEGRVVTTGASVSIASEGQPQIARLHWWRPAVASGPRGLLRAWQPPEVNVQGVVLRQRRRVWAAPDTVVLPAGTAARPSDQAVAAAAIAAAPAWLPEALSTSDQPIALANDAATLWVMPAEAAWGLATAIALAVFALGWAVARRTPLAVAVGAAGMLLVAVAWPWWALAIVGFLVAPAIAAGLLAVSTRRSVPLAIGQAGDGGSVSRVAIRSAGLIVIAVLTIAAISRALPAQERPAGDASATDTTGTAAASPPPGTAPAASASPTEDAEVDGSFAILIPLTDAGELAGTKVYVPESLYSALFRRWRSGQPAAEVLMRRAEYRIRFGATIEGRSIDPVRIEARLELETGPENVPVHLPLPPEAVHDVEIVVAGEAKAIRWFPAADGILLQLPRTGLAQLRIGIVPQQTVDAHGIHRVRMPIPPVADAEVTIDSDAPLDLLELDPCLGAVDALAPAGRLFADLGPASELGFQWRFRRSLDAGQSLPLVRRWWVHAGLERTVAECEIEPPGVAMAPGEQFELDIYDSVTPLVVSAGWSLIESVPVDALRHRLVLRSRQLAPGPIRLMWEIPHADEGAATADGTVLALPSVRPVRPVDLGPTLLAIDADPRLQVSLSDPAVATGIDLDRFFAGWSGYEGPVQQTVALASGPPRLVIRRTDPQPWRSTQRQHLHVTRGRLQLEMTATVHPGQGGCGPLRLIMPSGMEVHRLEMAGLPVTASARRWEQYQELPLPDPSQTEPVEIVFSGSLPLPASGKFRPPCLRLSAVPQTAGNYLVTRDTEVEISQVDATPLPVSEATLSDGRRLSSRWVPRWSWQLDTATAPQDPYLPGSYQVRDNPITTDARQLTTLTWEDGRWSMETVIQIRPLSGRPDFFAVELPAQWTDELQVEPTGSSWSRQPSTDEAFHLVQILPLDSASGRHELRIRGRLASSDTGRVSVPDVRLLGPGTRQRFFAVPRRLTSDPINWLPTGARQRRLPPPLAAVAPGGDTHATYEVTGRNWSAKLLPTTTSAASARVTTLDIQLFPQPDGRCLSLYRWDLLPAGSDQVRIQIPRSTIVHAAWSNGIPAPLQMDDATAVVPLNLSRLAQPLVLLVEFAAGTDQQAVPIPQLLDIPVASTWVARYATSAAVPQGMPTLPQSWSATSDAQRHVALAESGLAALEGSLERLAERPSDEVAAWLAPWLARIQQLRPASADQLSTDWERVTQRTEIYVDRVLDSPEQPLQLAAAAGPSADLPPTDWELQWTARHEGAAGSIPAALLSPPPPSSRQVNRTMLVIAFLLAAVLTVSVAGRALSRLARLPQLWLLLIGAVGLVLAPVPVAIAVCLLAVTSPLMRLRASAA